MKLRVGLPKNFSSIPGSVGRDSQRPDRFEVHPRCYPVGTGALSTPVKRPGMTTHIHDDSMCPAEIRTGYLPNTS
jgi:hypothetical protein